jgi:histone deacetylase 11
MKKISAVLLFVLVGLFAPLPLSSKKLFQFKKQFNTKEKDNNHKLPLVYHENYNISFFGLENFHAFDTQKYGKIYNYLITKAGISKNQFCRPEEITDEELRKVHSHSYLATLHKNASKTFAQISEVPLFSLLPNSITRKKALRPMRLATGGTLKATDLALDYGWAINLSGGYHHAKRDKGEGFCVYADISLAACNVFEKNPNAKIMIVDLDAHQGNGHESISGPDKRITIFDVYGKYLYPRDEQVKQYIQFNYPIAGSIKDDDYLAIIKNNLPKAITIAKPNLIIYNAGTDIFKNDGFSHMLVSENGIIQRDEFVFVQALQHNIPIVMVLSGGYTKESARIISKSIKNLITKIIPHYKPEMKQYSS